MSIIGTFQYPDTEHDAEITAWHAKRSGQLASELVFETHENEPLGHLLIGKLRLNPLGFVLSAIMVNASMQGLSMLLYWAFLPSARKSPIAR